MTTDHMYQRRLNLTFTTTRGGNSVVTVLVKVLLTAVNDERVSLHIR